MNRHDYCLCQPEDFALLNEFIGRYFSSPDRLPVSYQLDGKPQPFCGLDCTTERSRLDATIETVVFFGCRDHLQVRVNCTIYKDFPILEWTASITNTEEADSAVIDRFTACDAGLGGGVASLWHCTGDYYSIEGYKPIVEDVTGGGILISNNGRACDGALPYFRVMFPDRTVTAAVGWPGRWKAQFASVNKEVAISAGQYTLNTRLEPGETVRTPQMALMFTRGDSERAIQVWRRFYKAHILPHPDGLPLQPKLACCSYEDGEEFTASTEKIQLDSLALCLSHGFRPDVWWIDAGWYINDPQDGKPTWWKTGTWHVDKERFPDGLMPVSRGAAQAGADLLLWLEPERVYEGSELDMLHPEWLLKSGSPISPNRLLNLGNDNCRQWLTDHVCALIQDNGVKVYRQDFNFDPLDCWRENESADRQGMVENKHVQGYLRYWDDLLARNPGLWIDSCASGGRRNDLETMKRAVPLHYSDFGYGDLPVKVAFHKTMFEWLPYFKEAVVSWDLNKPGVSTRYEQNVDGFSFHCALAMMLFPTFDQRMDLPYELANKYIALWREAAGFLLEDFHPLTNWSRSGEEWVAWQFDSRASDAGFVQALRHSQCAVGSFTARLKNLDPKAAYRLSDRESGESFCRTGAELMDGGIGFDLPPRSARIWFYKREQPE